MSNRKKSLATYVKRLRKANSLSQRDLAQRLNVHHTYISKIESGAIEIMPSIEFLHNLARVWNDDPDTAMLAAGKADYSALENYLENVPLASVLIRELYQREMPESMILQLLDYADELRESNKEESPRMNSLERGA